MKEIPLSAKLGAEALVPSGWSSAAADPLCWPHTS